jgi:WhiB family redox-sensing transcriptional regulator
MASDRSMTLQHPMSASPEGTAYGSEPRGVRPDAIFLVSRTPPNLPPPQQEQWQWQMHARCVNYPSEVFFPEDGRGPRLRSREERAKRICLECPVRTKCLQHALTERETYGIWGATTPRERASLTTKTAP